MAFELFELTIISLAAVQEWINDGRLGTEESKTKVNCGTIIIDYHSFQLGFGPYRRPYLLSPRPSLDLTDFLSVPILPLIALCFLGLDRLDPHLDGSSGLSFPHSALRPERENKSMTTQTDIPSSSVPPPPIPKYDVFLSYSGEDALQNFIDLLCTSLQREGISTYRDREAVERGKAIQESRYAIVVLSGKYTNSWCLDAIAEIAECNHERVFPVFYDLEASDVRRQMEEAFSNHVKAFRDQPGTVLRWRCAITWVASLPGWDFQNGSEELVQGITVTILSTCPRISSESLLLKELVGIDSRFKKMISYLKLECPEVCIVGIWGMGGIGKTTIADAVFSTIQKDFECCAFLANIRERSLTDGTVYLQKLLLSMLLDCDVNVFDTDMRKNMIKHRLYNKKVLIVLDDVEQLGQLAAVCDRSLFGSGSRVIITSRDEHLLRRSGVDSIYKAELLTDVEALQLFNSRAFMKDQAREDYQNLSKKFVKYADGLPLALIVLGSFLRDRSIGAWSCALEEFKVAGHCEAHDILKISYDALDISEKDVFLDIACFFVGENIARVRRILNGCRNYISDITITILVERSLVVVDGGRLLMHDLLRQMGHTIISECSDLGWRSRLFIPRDIINVFRWNQGSSFLEGIAVDFPRTKEINCRSDAFSKMDRLRILRIRNVHMEKGPSYLSQELVLLEWSGYPTKSLPQNFNPDRLCEINLCYSMIEQLWTGTKDMPRLTDVNLSYSWKLTRTPDFTCATRLESLILVGCSSLLKIHPSIGCLKMLTCLNLKDCYSLESLPSKLETKSLRIVVLSGCLNVKKIPDFVGPMDCLSELYLDETAIEQLPVSIRLLTGLILLNLRDCKNLMSLPSDIGNLKSLKLLNICGCSKLAALPDSLGKIDCLEELDAGGTSISTLPSSVSVLQNLKVLSLHGCKGMPGERRRYPLDFRLPIADSGGFCSVTKLDLSDCNLQEGTIPKDLGCLSSLISLNVSKNSFVSLPQSIIKLSKLQNLSLESCKSLQNFPDLSPRIDCSIGAEGKKLSSCFNLINCLKLVVSERCTNIALAMLRRFLQGISYAGNSFETIIPGSEISELFSDRSVGPVVSMELPQQWHKNKWMGYAFCACFVIRRDLPVPANRLGKWKFGSHSTTHGLRCEMKSLADWCPAFACSQELGQIESEHLWLFYVSGDYFGTAWQETCHNIEFTFKTLGTGMEVKKCGVRLIYEQDLDLIR